jgi:hypothetical protein
MYTCGSTPCLRHEFVRLDSPLHPAAKTPRDRPFPPRPIPGDCDSLMSRRVVRALTHRSRSMRSRAEIACVVIRASPQIASSDEAARFD